MDVSLFRLINNLAGQSTILDLIGRFFASGLIWVILFLLLVIFAARATTKEQRHEFATVLIALFGGLFAYITNYLIGLVHFLPRPFAALTDVHLLIVKEATEKSFPSDHAAFAFAIAIAVFLAHRRWGVVFLALAVLVGLGRIFAGVHYPSDVLVGAIVGGAWAALVCHFGRGTFERLLKAES